MDFWKVTFDRNIKVKQYIILRSDLWMSKWKMVAQWCHAAVETYKLMLKDQKYKAVLDEWEKNNERHITKICLKIDSEEEIIKLNKDLDKLWIPCVLIRDNWVTELKPNTITALWVWPWYINDLEILKKLKLLR